MLANDAGLPIGRLCTTTMCVQAVIVKPREGFRRPIALQKYDGVITSWAERLGATISRAARFAHTSNNMRKTT